ncbi:MAG: class II aldolase/adducin family protein [Desulfobacterales bacterium]|nr:class II aldolase/adducin family protein [Desulfobacterales bacterium]
MEELVKKYELKLIQAGLAEPDGPCRPIIGGLDHIPVWNRQSQETHTLEPLFSNMAINSLVCFRPKFPYNEIMAFLAKKALENQGIIHPMDCETRTFLHDLPVVQDFSLTVILPALKIRKCVIVMDSMAETLGPAIIAHGSVSPEQGFVTASSVVFACYVKFFTDYLDGLQSGTAPFEMHQLYDKILPDLTAPAPHLPDLIQGPFGNEDKIYKAMIQAGKKTVDYGLVDSYFGNISYFKDGILYISQTGSSLDELSGCIDPVPIDGSSSAGLTASSELTAHMETIRRTGSNAILHGHPKFSVILSMDCDPGKKAGCKFKDRCHTNCPEHRSIRGIPIVPGEVGTGPTGLCNTLPPAFETASGVIVYGHGLFTLGKNDFSKAFATLLDVETQCRKAYVDKVSDLRK